MFEIVWLTEFYKQYFELVEKDPHNAGFLTIMHTFWAYSLFSSLIISHDNRLHVLRWWLWRLWQLVVLVANLIFDHLRLVWCEGSHPVFLKRLAVPIKPVDVIEGMVTLLKLIGQSLTFLLLVAYDIVRQIDSDIEREIGLVS